MNDLDAIAYQTTADHPSDINRAICTALHNAVSHRRPVRSLLRHHEGQPTAVRSYHSPQPQTGRENGYAVERRLDGGGTYYHPQGEDGSMGTLCYNEVHIPSQNNQGSHDALREAKQAFTSRLLGALDDEAGDQFYVANEDIYTVQASHPDPQVVGMSFRQIGDLTLCRSCWQQYSSDQWNDATDHMLSQELAREDKERLKKSFAPVSGLENQLLPQQTRAPAQPPQPVLDSFANAVRKGDRITYANPESTTRISTYVESTASPRRRNTRETTCIGGFPVQR